MPDHRKLIVVLIDGLSADYFKANPARLPYMTDLAARGLTVERLGAEVPATSMPGRASMITGVPAGQHGIYGNRILDGAAFRHANPDDMLVPSLARRASDAGQDVAGIGYAMVRPEDCATFQPAWWVRSFVQGRNFSKAPLHPGWERTMATKDPTGRLAGHPGAQPPAFDPADDGSGSNQELLISLASDQAILDGVAALACSDAPPDLILTEIAMTDAIQHDYGYQSVPAHWSLATADHLVGQLLYRLDQSGRRDDYVIAVTSDHGHGPIERALYPDTIIPGHRWESEGGTLHVLVRDQRDRAEVTARMADHGAQPLESSHVPAAQRPLIATFTAPPGQSFEKRPPELAAEAPSGPPQYVSSHGQRPGCVTDDRFCIFAGAGIAASQVPSATAEQFAPTLAQILGLELEDVPASALAA